MNKTSKYSIAAFRVRDIVSDRGWCDWDGAREVMAVRFRTFHDQAQWDKNPNWKSDYYYRLAHSDREFPEHELYLVCPLELRQDND